ncbi:MAG: CHAP domain-containing protein [Oscillospiraceae bacterium]|nr:CHAP domain-containing protein [Oscillospiraceae bacterium]
MKNDRFKTESGRLPHLSGSRLRRMLTAAVCAALLLGEAALPALAAESFRGSSSAMKAAQVYCGMKEHTHTARCRQEEKILACTLQEGEGHTHTPECWTFPKRLTCSLIEGEGHFHGEECYVSTESLVCPLPEGEEHTHTSECFVTEQTLRCTLSTQSAHTHTDACYSSEPVYLCGLENDPAHVHTLSCADPAAVLLLCTRPEQPPHTHTEACFRTEERLVCTLSEHRHSAECYQNETPRPETQADWIASVAEARLTGDWQHDFLEVAKTQLGYAPDGTTLTVNGQRRLYTRYGDWFSDNPEIISGEWCAMFLCFCLYYADIDALPFDCSCIRWLNMITETDSSLYHPYGDGYVPQPGDIIFFTYGRRSLRDTNDVREAYGLAPLSEDGTKLRADHVGVLVSMNSKGFRTIEGNNGPVSYHSYSFGSDGEVGDEELILGYCSLPENPHVRTLRDVTGLCTAVGDLPMRAQLYLGEAVYSDYQRWEKAGNGGALLAIWHLAMSRDGEPFASDGAVEYTVKLPVSAGENVTVSFLDEEGAESVPCTVEDGCVRFVSARTGTVVFSRLAEPKEQP